MQTGKKYIDGLSPMERYIVFTIDWIVAFVGFVLSFPLFILLYIILWLADKHNPIYSQERIGFKGRPFHIYKFRTMVINAEKNEIPQLARGEGDRRLTKLGKYLRTYHLDEIPQLWNVICGDMSLVGYRPERAYFVDRIIAQNPDYVYLYLERPGIFSMAAYSNGYTDTMEKMLIRLDMDLEHYTTRTLRNNWKPLFLTIGSILLGRKL